MLQSNARMRLERTLIGMVHLAPLPGSPRWDGSMERATTQALADARALATGGMDALLIENWGDAPFTAGRVEPATVAANCPAIDSSWKSRGIRARRNLRTKRAPRRRGRNRRPSRSRSPAPTAG